ncbi:MAG: diaminopimelate decarboxylase family protein, partial [Oscillospiraceae bacterium]
RLEGHSVDALSPGDRALALQAGFAPADIPIISYNVAAGEMGFAVSRSSLVSVDSLSQLQTYGEACPGTSVAVRLNPGVGAGHSQKVITGGKSKFGIMLSEIPAILQLAGRYGLRIAGVNQHIGSLFLEGAEYLAAAETLLKAALQFPALSFVDLGGGFGVPYGEEERLNLEELRPPLARLVRQYLAAAGRQDICIKTEPGRYVVAECGTLLGRVLSRKQNYGETYIGTDLGFNVLMRPVLYDSYHELYVYAASGQTEEATVVGNICESGDILAKSRRLPKAEPGDILAAEVAGAYGYCMSSNYTCRLRPAEVLLAQNGGHRLIRRRDTWEDLLRQFV